MYARILDQIIAMVQGIVTLPIYKAALPADESIAIDIGAGGSDSVMFNRATLESISVVINGKSRDMQKVRGELDAIHHALSRASVYARNDEYQIYAVETTGAPRYAGRDPGDQWLFVSSVTVKFYYKEGVIVHG